MVTKTQLENIVKTHEKYSKAYFWTPRCNAAGRRAAEFDDEYEFELNGEKYEIRQRYEESCKHCYYSMTVYVDGAKKDIRAVKKALKLISEN
jgi:hypothetical protein